MTQETNNTVMFLFRYLPIRLIRGWRRRVADVPTGYVQVESPLYGGGGECRRCCPNVWSESPPSENVAVSLSRSAFSHRWSPAVWSFSSAIHSRLPARLDELTESQRERKMEGSTLPLSLAPLPLSYPFLVRCGRGNALMRRTMVSNFI